MPVVEVPSWRRPVAFFALVGVLGAALAAALLGEDTLSPAPAPAPAVVVEAVPLDPEPPALRALAVMISSDPAGATVFLGDLDIGTTPFAGKLSLELDEPTQQPLRLELAGHRPTESVLDLSGETASAHVILQAIPRPKPAKKSSAPAQKPSEPVAVGPSVTADGVVFSAAEAAATVRFLNQATEDDLRRAGIAGRQVNIIREQRPFASIEVFAATHYIGEKTVTAARRAAL